MQHFFTALILLMLTTTGCRDKASATLPSAKEETIRHAKGLSIRRLDGYALVTVSQPWPGANKSYQYIFAGDFTTVPDSLSHLPKIRVPIQNIVVTSTTHIPSLEMLGMEHTLGGFPMLDYISSTAIRNRIDQGKVRELGSNQNLNVEAVIDLAPEVLIGYGIDNTNPTLDKLSASGISVVLNGDWNEQTPLGKAEWIKLFGALYGKEKEADSIFNTIERQYNEVRDLAQRVKRRPKVMAGSIYQNKWYMPQGDSWGALIIKEAGGDYLYANTRGTGSLSLPTEQILAQAEAADIWIGPEMHTLREMADANPHYAKFRAFREGRVYHFTGRKGSTGGILYYELGPNRPDIVLKDVIKILHPDLLPGYEPYFFQKLR